VFQNLLNNAAKYTPKGGTITLYVERAGAEARVSVRDTGIGIPTGMQSRIFELFTRVHPSNAIKTSGLGIGLALAKQLVELHGGRIEVRSDGAGAGSEFVVTLPLIAAADELVPPPAAAAANADNVERRVLIVDDNRDAAESLALLLGLAGCQVALAFDGMAAIATAATFRPDVVLLDIGMPGMDGYETARHLRATADGSNMLLVALTGWGQEEDKQQAIDAGFDEHFTKPMDSGVLAALMKRAPRR
jgi:CheY-like chemotaxis protein